jgi:nicotinamidase-related amidase
MSTAILLCDLWDSHWCSTAAVGTARIARRAAPLTARFRSRGGVVIHAPSDTMGFYSGHPAREYVLSLLLAGVTRKRPTDLGSPPDAPFPPAGRRCPDLPECAEPPGPPWPWTRQHPAIEIDPADAVLDGGEEMLAVVDDRKIEHVFLAGVHTNLCLLQRPFGITALRAAGIPCALLGDLTEAMPPAFTDAALDHIDRHFCPVVSSDEVV